MKTINYYLILTALLCSFSCNKFPDLGSGYELHYNSMKDIYITKPLNSAEAPSVFIYGHINDYAFDNKFIVIEEIPRDSVPGSSELSFDEYEKKFQSSTFRQYWIINKTIDPVFIESEKNYSNVFGPFSKENYSKIKKTLLLNSQLKLKSE